MPWTYRLPIPRYNLERSFLAEPCDDGEWIKVEDLVLKTQPLDFTNECFLNMQETLARFGFDLLLIEENRRYGVVTDKNRRMVVCFDSFAEIEGWLRGIYDALDRFEMGKDGKPVLRAKYLAEIDAFIKKEPKGAERCGG